MLDTHVQEGTSVTTSVAGYFSTMLDQSMDWSAAEWVAKKWGGTFCLKGVMSVEDARRAMRVSLSTALDEAALDRVAETFARVHAQLMTASPASDATSRLAGARR